MSCVFLVGDLLLMVIVSAYSRKEHTVHTTMTILFIPPVSPFLKASKLQYHNPLTKCDSNGLVVSEEVSRTDISIVCNSGRQTCQTTHFFKEGQPVRTTTYQFENHRNLIEEYSLGYLLLILIVLCTSM